MNGVLEMQTMSALGEIQSRIADFGKCIYAPFSESTCNNNCSNDCGGCDSACDETCVGHHD